MESNGRDGHMKIPEQIKQTSEVTWEIPKTQNKEMKVPVKIFASKELLEAMDEAVFSQAINVSCLKGIQKYSFVMPDGHSGYGFPIGGVAGMDLEEGIISPGGIGFDINCGMRALTSNLTYSDVKEKIKELVDLLFKKVPTGVGCKGFVKINKSQLQEIMTEGSKWAIENGYGWEKDIKNCEDNGKITGANPNKVSEKALKRGISQLGTLGSGNHYLEIQRAKQENIFSKETAKQWGITKDEQITAMIHCGSRGFGHQIASDYLQDFLKIMPKYNLKVLDRELSCAPFQSKEGQDYFSAMACAANTAFANRQIIMHRIRECFEQVFKQKAEDMEMNLIYDVAHNIAKIEEHKIDGKTKKILMHRKGATRAFGPKRMDSHPIFSKTGQPVIIGGSMETGSYLLAGTNESEETFCSTAHGSGRLMSRTQAKKEIRGEALQKKLLEKGIYIKSASMQGLAEEAGNAYKDIHSVVNTMEKAGITKKVVSLIPIGNIKG
jgi:tRNA-splicing ligase RtcB (3'-phosphate/5'-hydroxy nucleic acid ligase)